jgi:hypothetical protein
MLHILRGKHKTHVTHYPSPIYYEIRGRFHCLFKGTQTLTGFFKYPDQRCLALYRQEAFRLRAHTLQPPTRLDPIQRITSFTVLPSGRGTKRQTDTNAALDSRSMRIRETFPFPTRFQRHDQTRSLPRRRRRSPRPHWCTTSTN